MGDRQPAQAQAPALMALAAQFPDITGSVRRFRTFINQGSGYSGNPISMIWVAPRVIIATNQPRSWKSWFWHVRKQPDRTPKRAEAGMAVRKAPGGSPMRNHWSR